MEAAIKLTVDHHPRQSGEFCAPQTGKIPRPVDRCWRKRRRHDAREDRQFGAESSGPALPADLKRRGDRLARLKACREKLANRAAAAAARQQEKIAARDMEEKATGRRKRGLKPKEPDASVDPPPGSKPD